MLTLDHSASNIPIKIQIGHGESTFAIYVHQSRLEKVSQWFKRTAAHTDVIELNHVTGETLQSFSKWVYGDGLHVEGLVEEMEKAESGDKDVDEVVDEPEGEADSATTAKGRRMVAELTIDLVNFRNHEGEEQKDDSSDCDTSLNGDDLPWYLTSSLNTRGQIFGRLLELYVFGITYEVPSLKLAVTLAWQRFSYTTSTYPCAMITRNIFQRLSLSEGLVQYVIACYAYYIDIEDMEKNRSRLNTIPSEFLTEALIVSNQGR